MDKNALMQHVMENANLSKIQAKAAVEAVISGIGTALEKGDKVQLVGFGTFESRKRNARKGRNPQTGEEVEIAETFVPAFKPGKSLKDAVATALAPR